MLTKEHAIKEYKYGKIFPDRLTKVEHGHYIDYARQMLTVYNQAVGKTRIELHRQVKKIFQHEPDCPQRRIDAFCKLLDDAAVYDRDRFKKAADLRLKVWSRAAGFHPLVKSIDRLFDNSETIVKEEIAGYMDRKWADIEKDFFADVRDFHRLVSFPGYPDPAALLSRYNVAQVQASLYSALKMDIWVSQDLKTIMRYIKLARLLHRINLDRRGIYRITLDGPVSVLRQTSRYGVYMAKFLPALIACDHWKLKASVGTRRKGGYVSLELSSRDKLCSNLPPLDEFDSNLEEKFADKWGEGKREGWTLIREGGILHINQRVFLPDFLFVHDDGRKVFLEIVGFWTPEYLQEKFATLKLFREHPVLVAVAESTAQDFENPLGAAIHFKKSLAMKDVLTRLEEF